MNIHKVSGSSCSYLTLTPENDYFQNCSFCLRTSSASSLYVGYIRIKLQRHSIDQFLRYEYLKLLVTKHMCDVTPSHNMQNTIMSTLEGKFMNNKRKSDLCTNKYELQNIMLGVSPCHKLFISIEYIMTRQRTYHQCVSPAYRVM